MHRASDYDFQLPESLVAREPAEARDGARLLVVTPEGVRHENVVDLDRLLPENALLVVNDTRVVPARLFADKPTGGRVELLLVDRLRIEDSGAEVWRAMASSNKPMRTGPLALHGERAPTVEVLATAAPYVELRLTPSGESVDSALGRVGEMPLPPYIVSARKERGEPRASADDRERYQTVFAREPGAVAAPTAGLHLSLPLLQRMAQRGIDRVAVTLHVGPGTFAPLRSDVLEDNELHAESYEVSASTADAINAARAEGRPIVAVGTTVVRTLEASDHEGRVRAGRGETKLFIKPGFRFGVVDHLLSNFHLPQSSLLVLVATFAGKERVLAAYREAVERGYRFYSYGDATLTSRAP
ncbi:MAG: tRNA preQ1(34) S-adenosylmethionine ribosyltransferase-isomerase QueA [Polyangia bacterium]